MQHKMHNRAIYVAVTRRTANYKNSWKYLFNGLCARYKRIDIRQHVTFPTSRKHWFMITLSMTQCMEQLHDKTRDYIINKIQLHIQHI